MKKAVFVILFVFINLALSAEVPFVGKLWFNFAGGSGTNQYIEIKKNGDTRIGSCGIYQCSDSYRGKYKKIFKLYSDDSATYSFTANKVMKISSKTGKAIQECDEHGIEGLGNKPCIQDLN